jgi:hypothetical protein
VYFFCSILNIFESFDINFCNFFITKELISYELGGNFHYFDKNIFSSDFFFTNFINIKEFSTMYNLSLSTFLTEPSIFVKSYLFFNTGLNYNNIIFLHGYIHLWNYHPDIFLDINFNLIKPLLLKINYCKVYYSFYIFKGIHFYNNLILSNNNLVYNFFNEIELDFFYSSEYFFKIMRVFLLDTFKMYLNLYYYFPKIECSFQFHNFNPVQLWPLEEGTESYKVTEFTKIYQCY